MKKVIRLAAAVLVALALIASCALAEETASVMIPQGEGSYAEIPAASINAATAYSRVAAAVCSSST